MLKRDPMHGLFKKPVALLDHEFYQWEKLLEKRAGVQLPESQQALLQTQVAQRMGELGIESFSDYFNYVSNEAKGSAEWQILVDRLVFKDTRFFRNRPSLELVIRYIEKKLQQSNKTSMEIWSVGCATGEEPYALSGITNDCFRRANLDPYYGVTAVDISLPALSIARKGEYSLRSVSLLSDEERSQYFTPVKNKRLKVKKALMERVCFSQLNILHLRKRPVQLMDVIFCQNVLVYFRRWRRREILNELVSNLKPGGLLIVGAGEVPGWKHEVLERVKDKDVEAYIRPASSILTTL